MKAERDTPLSGNYLSIHSPAANKQSHDAFARESLALTAAEPGPLPIHCDAPTRKPIIDALIDDSVQESERRMSP
jgi:hypothetical protein